MPSKEKREGNVLRIHDQYLVSIQRICQDMGWYPGDPIKLKTGEDGIVTVENLQSPEVLDRRIARLKDVLSNRVRTGVEVDDSFRNLVWCFKEELAAVRAGDPIDDLLSPSVRKGMKRKGILVVAYSTGLARSTLSEEADRVLDETLAEEQK